MMVIMNLITILSLAIFKEKLQQNTSQKSKRNDLSLFHDQHSQVQVIMFLIGTAITLHYGNSLSFQSLEQ